MTIARDIADTEGMRNLLGDLSATEARIASFYFNDGYLLAHHYGDGTVYFPEGTPREVFYNTPAFGKGS
ncbi:MAG: hypothetical protein ACREXM_15405 [Gammaproteobacteria bacterium]